MNPQRRKPLIAGNWKMHHGGAVGRRARGRVRASSRAAARTSISSSRRRSPRSPRAPHECDGSRGRGRRPEPAPEGTGAFTGEISAAMLVEAGAPGSSWATASGGSTFGETDAFVAEKVAAALAAGLMPIVCVGETLERARGGRDARGRRAPGATPCSPILRQGGARRSPSPTSRSGPSERARTPARRRREEVHAAIRGLARRPSFASCAVADAHPLRRVGQARQRRALLACSERGRRPRRRSELGRGLLRCYRPRGRGARAHASPSPRASQASIPDAHHAPRHRPRLRLRLPHVGRASPAGQGRRHGRGLRRRGARAGLRRPWRRKHPHAGDGRVRGHLHAHERLARVPVVLGRPRAQGARSVEEQKQGRKGTARPKDAAQRQPAVGSERTAPAPRRRRPARSGRRPRRRPRSSK